ncbi:MAG: RNA polymerase factor sigma-54 [Candidatus Omnitrophica bacterium]|nr:RNA polymerase factor sigma-54 [Candidatus Omnitrophota bacterium]
MVAEPNLRQEIIQKLKLSPRLFKAIHILELTLPELRELLEQEFEENPLIEVEDKIIKDEPPAQEEPEEDWSEYFAGEREPNLKELEKRRAYQESLITKAPTLQEELLHQLRLNDISEEEYQIGETIIGNIDDDGYLGISVEEIAKDLNKEINAIEKILSLIQTFYPAGVGARDLRECLLLQLKRRNETDSLAFKIVENHFLDLENKRYEKIIKELHITPEELKAVNQQLAKLDPKPGRAISNERPVYVLPDLVLEETEEGRYIVKLNNEYIPSIRINQYYLKLLKDTHTPEEAKRYIQEKLSAGEWLIKAIHQRQETILKIAQYIVDFQKEFFAEGKGHLKPLTLAHISEKIGLDESTVSRTINGKYIETPWGIFELKDFFTKAVKGEGKEISIDFLKVKISELIKGEDPKHPFSDQEIVDKLKAEGINIARRTVTKYREELNILPSHLRKQKL